MAQPNLRAMINQTTTWKAKNNKRNASFKRYLSSVPSQATSLFCPRHFFLFLFLVSRLCLCLLEIYSFCVLVGTRIASFVECDGHAFAVFSQLNNSISPCSTANKRKTDIALAIPWVSPTIGPVIMATTVYQIEMCWQPTHHSVQ